MLVKIEHPVVGPQKTFLQAEVAASATSSTVENNDGFSSGDLVLFGKLGEEKTEIVTLTGKTGNTTINHSTGPVFSHAVRTPLYEVPYDQVEISRATSQGGSYSVLTTIALDVDEKLTIYDDTAGDTTSWYKVRYYNSQSTSYSDYSDEVQGVGYTEDSLRSMSDEVLEDLGDPFTEEFTRGQIKRYLRAGVRKLTRELIKAYPSYRTAYTTQQLTSSTQTYSLPSRFLAFKRVDVNFSSDDSTTAYKAEFVDEQEGYPRTTYHTNDPKVFIRGSLFGLKPTPTSSNGYAYIWYWDYPADMSDETDEHGLPYGARDLLVNFALNKAWLTKDPDRASGYRRAFNDELDDYIEFVGQSRQDMTKKHIEVTFGRDLYDY